MTPNNAMDIYAAEGDGALDWLQQTFDQLAGLIPTALWLSSLLMVVFVMFITKSLMKSITAAMAAAIMLTLTGNMPILSDMIGNELGAPAGPTEPAPDLPPSQVQ